MAPGAPNGHTYRERVLTPYREITSKSTEGLNVRPETTELPEENIGSGSDGKRAGL